MKRDIERQLDVHPNHKSVFEELLEQPGQLLMQKRESKNKLYSLHSPETKRIAKGKANKHYAFGVMRVSLQHKSGILFFAHKHYQNHSMMDTLVMMINSRRY